MHAGNTPDSSAAVWPVIRAALVSSSPRVRRMIRGVALFAVLMIALQVWDSRNSIGAAGIAEFLSVSLAVAGVALLGLAGALQVWMEDVASKQVSHDDGVARMLLALPAVGFGAGVALGSATVLMIVRGVLGAELLLAAIGTLLYGALTIIAVRTVVRSTQTLFRFAALRRRSVRL